MGLFDKFRRKSEPTREPAPTDIGGSTAACEAYIDTLVSQAITADRIPVLVTNRTASPSLLALLHARGVLWRKIEEGL